MTREAWGNGNVDYVQIHCSLDELYGISGPDAAACKELYERAKHSGDVKAAYAIVIRRLIKRKLDALREIRSRLGRSPLFVYPRRIFVEERAQTSALQNPTNVLPVMLARALRDYVGGDISRDIKQITVRKRTHLDRFVRFLYQPEFKGQVISGRPYILVDDVMGSGALFASLRGHIIGGGGIVIGMVALAHGTGRDQKLAITKSSVLAMRKEFGEGVDRFWQEKFGHGIELLTEQEAVYLLWRWRPEQKVYRGDALLQHLGHQFANLEAAHRKFRKP